MSDPAVVWEGLRKDARRLENDIDEKLSAFAKHGTGASGRPADLDQISSSRAAEIDQLLSRLSEVNEAMSRCVSAASPALSASMMHMLQRHREILYDYTQEFKKTKANINMYTQHAQLMSHVHARNEDGSYKQSGSANVDSLLRERSTIGNADRVADGIVAQALQARDNLAQQRDLLNRAYSRLTSVGQRFPAIGSIIGAINRKSKKDRLVIFSVIGACLLFLILYSLR
eukprot:tig00000144_g9007.t1